MRLLCDFCRSRIRGRGAQVRELAEAVVQQHLHGDLHPLPVGDVAEHARTLGGGPPRTDYLAASIASIGASDSSENARVNYH